MRFIFFILLSTCFYVQGIIQKKVLICGICKDVATRLPYTIKIIEKIGNLFQDYRVIIYENNSTDSTAATLKKWENKNHKVNCYCETVIDAELKKTIVNLCDDKAYGQKFIRYELIARARNIVLEKAMSEQYQEYPYIIWIDMDFKRSPAIDGIIEAFTTSHKWDAILAYGIDPNGKFWDWFALRDNVEPFGPELLGSEWYCPKSRSFDKKSDWYPVYSAFGGCGIYKKESIKGCKYSALVTKDLEQLVKQLIEQGKSTKHPVILKYLDDLKKLSQNIYIESPIPNLTKIKNQNIGIILHKSTRPIIWKMNTAAYQYPIVCEHVSFHASMIVNGHEKIFINPRMVFTYGE